jgi:hypothetical protein
VTETRSRNSRNSRKSTRCVDCGHLWQACTCGLSFREKVLGVGIDPKATPTRGKTRR